MAPSGRYRRCRRSCKLFPPFQGRSENALRLRVVSPVSPRQTVSGDIEIAGNPIGAITHSESRM